MLFECLTLYLTETPFNTSANRADPDQAALVRPVPLITGYSIQEHSTRVYIYPRSALEWAQLYGQQASEDHKSTPRALAQES